MPAKLWSEVEKGGGADSTRQQELSIFSTTTKRTESPVGTTQGWWKRHLLGFSSDRGQEVLRLAALTKDAICLQESILSPW